MNWIGWLGVATEVVVIAGGLFGIASAAVKLKRSRVRFRFDPYWSLVPSSEKETSHSGEAYEALRRLLAGAIAESTFSSFGLGSIVTAGVLTATLVAIAPTIGLSPYFLGGIGGMVASGVYEMASAKRWARSPRLLGRMGVR